jgi:SAM-dependent methyltransferase
MHDTTIVERDWSAVAASWDNLVAYVDGHSGELTAALVERVAPKPGDRVLEVGAGPGSLAATWARLVGPDGVVVISDIAAGMVEVAARRTGDLCNVTVAVVDASAIDRPDDTFDVVASRMALMFTPDPAAAFSEAHRVLRPGGRLGVTTWADPQHNPWMACVGMAAIVNGLLAGGPPTGPGGVFSLGDPAQLERLAAHAGFVETIVEQFDITIHADDIATHVQRVASLGGPLAAAFQHASPGQLAAVHRTASDLAAAYITDTGVEIPGRALLLSARHR